MSELSTAEPVAAQVDRLVRRDLRWFVNSYSSERLSHRESLRSACQCRMRNIAPRWWDQMTARIDDLTDEQCDDALHEIERLSEDAVDEWRRYQ